MFSLWVGVPAVDQDLTTEYGAQCVSLRDVSPGFSLHSNFALHMVYLDSK